jgi:hypothetical protein
LFLLNLNLFAIAWHFGGANCIMGRADRDEEIVPMINKLLRRLQPDGAAELELMNNAAWESADPELLELCRCLIVSMLEDHTPDQLDHLAASGIGRDKLAALGDWAASDVFSPLERAALEYTEQFVISVSNMSDEQVEALRAHLGDEKTYAFAAALYVIEMTERLRMVSNVVLGKGGNG